MAHLSPELRILLDLHFDGELSGVEASRAESVASTDTLARAYLHNLAVIRAMVQIDHKRALEQVDFENVFSRVAARLADVGMRDAELELLAMAQADGEPLSQDDEGRVAAYLAASPEARSSVTGLGVLGDLARADAARLADVDLSAMRDSLKRALDAEDARAATSNAAHTTNEQSIGQRIWAWMRPYQAVWASAATALVMGAVLVPRLSLDNERDKSNRPAQTVVNNYYVGADAAAQAAATGVMIESVEYNPGYWASVRPGNPEQDIAPVVWIAADPLAEGTDSDDGSAAGGTLYPGTGAYPAAPATGTLESGRSL
jgi:hypothetical protein